MPAAWTTPRTWTAGELVTAAIGNSAWRDNLMYLKDSPTFDGNITVTGTSLHTGVATFTAAPVFSSATASQAVFVNGSKALVSNAITGTGNVVMSASPTLTGTIIAAALTASGVITGNGGFTGALTGNVIGGTISGTTGTFSGAVSVASLSSTAPVTLTQSFRGLTLRTSPNADVAATTVTLDHADEIVMHDGTRVATWDDLSAAITTSGAGGLDTGSEGASRWYSIHAIRKSSDGTKNLLLHRAKSYDADQSSTTGTTSVQLRFNAATTAVGQTVTPAVTGFRPFLDATLFKTASPTGYVWLELQTVAGSVLATSRKLDMSLVATSSQRIRFVFDSPVSLTASTQYRLALVGTSTISAVNYLSWTSSSANPYAGGAGQTYDGATWTDQAGYDRIFYDYVTQNDTALTMPSGYDQYAQVGWVYNGSGSDFQQFAQHNRKVRYFNSPVPYSAASAVPVLTSMSVYIPPVPCYGVFLGSDGTAGGRCVIAGNSPGATNSNTAAGGLRVDAPVANYTFAMGSVLLEQDSLYAAENLSSTFTIIMDGYEW